MSRVKQIEKLQYSVMVENDPRPDYKPRSDYMAEHARRGAEQREP